MAARRPGSGAALPASLEPELATLVDRPPPGEWLYELKFDGYRLLARVEGRDVRLFTRNGNDWTERFPTLHGSLRKARLPAGWYDGEIVVLDERGQPNFGLLQNAIDGPANKDIVFYLFDAPFLAGEDLRRSPVEERRQRLQAAMPDSPRLRFSPELPGNWNHLLSSACNMELEGVIGKRRGSPYAQGRSLDWIKLKCAARQEFVIGGYTWPDHSRVGIGALLVGYFDAGGTLHYAGKVGTGYTGEMFTMLRRRLDAIARERRPFPEATGHDRHATWVEPTLVCEVVYREWPQKGQLRHASFKGLREDKPARAVRRERSGLQPATTRPARREAAPAKAPAAKGPELVRVTHGSRVIDRSSGITKLELVRYYAEVSPWLLPHLQGRHTFIRRAPMGIEAPMIFQEHPEGLAGLRGTDPALWPGHEPAIAFESPEDIVAAAQLGMVELHTWNSTARSIDKPDRLVFDLDPGEGLSWPQLRQSAELVRTMLAELGLACWLKTSGGKGLHVVAPLKPEFDHDTVKSFARAIAQHMARTIPQLFTAVSGSRNRVGRVFLDYLRNGRSQTTATALSARARPGIGVSMPIDWDELAEVEAGDQWTARTAVARLREMARDPWAGYWRRAQGLKLPMKRLGFHPD